MKARALILLALAILPGCAQRAEVRRSRRVARKAAAGYAPLTVGQDDQADPPKISDRRARPVWGERGDPGPSQKTR